MNYPLYVATLATSHEQCISIKNTIMSTANNSTTTSWPTKQKYLHMDSSHMRILKLEQSASITLTSHFFICLPFFDTISLGLPTYRDVALFTYPIIITVVWLALTCLTAASMLT